MAIDDQPLFTDSYLSSRWTEEYLAFKGSPSEAELLERLKAWASKKPQKETVAESAFIAVFFKQIWGYHASGEVTTAAWHTLEPQFKVSGAGQGGGTGAADLALGYWGRAGVAETPQVLCEFKDVRSGLDKPQNRKGNTRSPVKQCADYLKEAFGALYGNEPVLPCWGIVTDMNEFRLYWRKKMPTACQRFVLKPSAGECQAPLLGEGDASSFQRFLFWRMFRPESLLTTGGPCALERLLTDQWVQESAIEADFYREYQSYRQEVFAALVDANPTFKGSRGKLVRLTQRLLDRCIFILFCEDMGAALRYPPNILRDVLAGVSTDPDYDPTDDAAWFKIKKLFVAMRDGSPFRDHRINRFNGGLFAEEPDLESLHIPTRLFCAKGQGATAGALLGHKKTLLFFSAKYNFGVSDGSLQRSIDLYTLGRIFEQSITELEFMEAKADGRASLTELSKRKRDGVYYTPEWITGYIVEETVGAHLAEVRQRLELDPLPVFADEELEHYRRARASGKKDKRFNTERVERYVANLDRYVLELDDIKVLDPACGSGAFLIRALDRLVSERRWLASERERVMGTQTLFDTDAATKAILSGNIYGVDINEESVEITRLALWLHTALPDRPLTSLDHNIRCGNSLIDGGFYSFKQEELFSDEVRERINAFDWTAAFPEVFARPNNKAGFDCVVGNPPYVKLQHFKQVLPDVAQYLVAATTDGAPLYPSTQRQNFDMYLPFIERGIGMLNAAGRMGFIAPNVWLVSEYGIGLRNQLLDTRRLERWVDFKDFPVFDEAMTYTALQFYRGSACDAIKCAFAPNGEVVGIEWTAPHASIEYTLLPRDEPWVFLPKREQDLIDRLAAACDTLEEVSAGIVVGVQTSADHIFHLEKVGSDRYRQFPKAGPPIEVPIEDGIMRPLVSGEEAKRYQIPITKTFVLFPYNDDGRVRLRPSDEMARLYPMAWTYLRTNEAELRSRERGAFDDDQWYRFGRNQNIDKQKLRKLGVAQTVPEMRVFADPDGAFCFNNVRVNGILVNDETDFFYLLGLLNARVVDFVFRRKGKLKEPRPSGSYFEANKQYIAPLPIPRASAAQKKQVGKIAIALQQLHSNRRDLIAKIQSRLSSSQMVAAPRPPKWIWADVGDVASWSAQNPEGLTGRALTTWAKQRVEEEVAAHVAKISSCFVFGGTMCAAERDGELRFFAGDHCVVSGVYVNDEEAPLILAQWRQKARDTFVSDSINASKVIGWLLDIKTTDNPALVDQIRKLNTELDAIEREIRRTERQMDDLAYDLFNLTEDERRMVEADTRPRCNARMPQPPP